ncbi:MAG: hypothetical protein AB3N64_06290 [Puniceicoccaceae bacterium]
MSISLALHQISEKFLQYLQSMGPGNVEPMAFCGDRDLMDAAGVAVESCYYRGKTTTGDDDYYNRFPGYQAVGEKSKVAECHNN